MTERFMNTIARFACEPVENEFVLVDRGPLRTHARRGRRRTSSIVIARAFDFVRADVFGACQIANDQLDYSETEAPFRRRGRI